MNRAEVRRLQRRRRAADALALLMGAVWGAFALASIIALTKGVVEFEVWLMFAVAGVVISWYPLWWVLENSTVDTTEPRFGWGGEVR